MLRFERHRLRLAGLILQKDFHATFRRFQRRVTEPRQLNSLFKQFESRIQRKIPALQLLDDFLETLRATKSCGSGYWGLPSFAEF